MLHAENMDLVSLGVLGAGLCGVPEPVGLSAGRNMFVPPSVSVKPPVWMKTASARVGRNVLYSVVQFGGEFGSPSAQSCAV